ncbi:MAG TPA: DUF983 domain-containing protein [Stellaceae bacterium]|nr:DUF983 domain-containing protein [Stellaceae bacterium]
MSAHDAQGHSPMNADAEPVSLTEAMRRGFMLRCPNCGKGRLFGRFLKVVDHCAACGEVMSHHRADDFPAYLVIILIGHVLVPAALIVEIAYSPPLWLHALLWLPLTAISAVALLQPVKGAIVGLQWQMGMHGFAPAKERRLAGIP